MELYGAALLEADPPKANSTTDTHAHLLSGTGDTMSTSATGPYGQI